MGVWSRQGVWRFCEVEEGRICSVNPTKSISIAVRLLPLPSLSLLPLFPKKAFSCFVLGFSLASAWRRMVMAFPLSSLPLRSSEVPNPTRYPNKGPNDKRITSRPQNMIENTTYLYVHLTTHITVTSFD